MGPHVSKVGGAFLVIYVTSARVPGGPFKSGAKREAAGGN